MKQAKVRSYRKIRKTFGLGWGYRALFRVGLRLLILLLPLLPFIAMAMVFSLPQTPHLRTSYTYTGSHDHPNYRACQYLGVHGTVQVMGQNCPLITFMNGKP